MSDPDVKWMTSKSLKCKRCVAVVRHSIGVQYIDGKEKFVCQCLRCREISDIPD